MVEVLITPILQQVKRTITGMAERTYIGTLYKLQTWSRTQPTITGSVLLNLGRAKTTPLKLVFPKEKNLHFVLQ